MKKLAHTSLKRFCDPAALGFETTASLDAKKEIIGQARAAAAFDFGLGTRRAGYNIYVAGIQGSGKTTFAAHFAKQVAQNEGAPPDLAYVYNFKEPKTPKLLTTKPGLVATFKEDLQEMIEILTTEIPKVFEGDDYEQSRNEITKKFDKLRDAEFKAFSAEAKKKDFDVRVSEKGMSFAPIVDGKTLDIEDYEALSSEEQDDISERSSQIQEEAYVIIAKVRQLDAEAKELIKELDYKTSLFALGHQFSRLQEKYGDENCILEYLSMLKEDILENMHNFLAIEATEDEEGLANALPWIAKKSKEDAICKYKVNIIADNGGLAGAPVHVAECGTYAHIMGEIEYDSEFGNLTTDYMKIKPGLLHKANGGYLILQAKDVLATPFLWENLKRTLKTKEITIENPREHQAGINVTTIRPAPVPFDTKIILVGGGYYLDILRHHDEDFADLFKVSALFDYEMPYNDENILEMCRFVKRFAQDDSMPDFTACGVAAVIEHSTRLAGNQNKLTSRFDRITELLTESCIWAKRDGTENVAATHVKKAIKQREYRLGLYEEKMSELIENNVIMIETKGAKIGQINGLAALDTGQTNFAKPTKITATTYVGKAGVVNIESEADLSGEIHDKGMQIVIGFLGQKYAHQFPLSMSCRVCFEQSYSGVDGDSASSTELYAIISSLAEMPIDQGVAVTGSVNQKGDIQAVGSITAKIEGFFDLCNKRGLTGTQGVIIPAQNEPDLTLNDEVIAAVQDGKFHIYSIKSIDEGIEILMKTPADEIHEAVWERLKFFHEAAVDD